MEVGGDLSLAVLSKIKPMQVRERGVLAKKKKKKNQSQKKKKKGSFSIQCEEQKVYF